MGTNILSNIAAEIQLMPKD